MNNFSNRFRRFCGLSLRWTARVVKGSKVPLILFGMCCYQLYHYPTVKAAKFSLDPQQYMEPFSIELYEQIKDKQDVIVFVDAGFVDFVYENVSTLLQELADRADMNGRRIRLLHVSSQQQIGQIEQYFGLKLQFDTIFLVKNRYFKQPELFNSHDFFNNRKKIFYYFSPAEISRDEMDRNIKLLPKIDRQLTLLLYYVDKNDPEYEKHESVFKTIELVLTEFPKSNFIPILINNKEDQELFGLAGVPSGSKHLLQKHEDKFNTVQPNLQIGGIPYHLIKNIEVLRSNGSLALPTYLEKINTFSTVPKEYIVKLFVDKNQISRHDLHCIVAAINRLKTDGTFSNVSFSIDSTKIRNRNSNFLIVAQNVNKLMVDGDITTGAAAPAKAIAEHGKHSHTYLFDVNDPSEVTVDRLRKFIDRVQTGKEPEYYESQMLTPYSGLDKLTASNFRKKVLQDDKDHLVLEYRKGCAGCKKIGAVVTILSDILEQSKHKYYVEGIETHRINSTKNVVEGQIQFPYTPVLLYYKNGWKPRPVVVDTQEVYQKPQRLIEICEILSEVKPLNMDLFEKLFDSDRSTI